MITPTPTATHLAEFEIAQNIEGFLAAKRISRTDIHAAAGISRPTFNAKMAGGSSFTVKEILRIANALNVHPAEILPASITSRDAA